VSLGGPWQVVGGPVAVTGWDRDLSVAQSATTAGRTMDLSRGQMVAVEFLHADILSVLSGRVVARPAAWVTEIRGFVAFVEAAEPHPRDADRARMLQAAREDARRFLAEDLF
jgi:hypothetical protein